IEPTEYDADFFDMNPLAFWGRREAAKRGFQSVSASIYGNYKKLRRILGAYGIKVDPKFAKPLPEFSDFPSKSPDNYIPRKDEGLAAV
ncbi:MAG: hypothetical protein H8E19_16720, partial [Deltaproteobacteria bacterium]|nr:hypothetical protein [Candidatus Desulfacyla euxinica]